MFDRFWELVHRYRERFGDDARLVGPAWGSDEAYDWTDEDYIRIYEECLETGKPFDYHDPRWSWNQMPEAPLPPGVVA